MNYIHTDEIINEVKNRFPTYFASNKVDGCIFPSVLSSSIGKMRLRIYPEKKAMVHIDKCKGELPVDFKSVCLAVACNSKVEWHPTSLATKTEERIVCELNLCETVCDVCTNDCGNMYKIIQKIDFKKFEYQDYELLRPSKNCVHHCASGSPNFMSKSTDEFEVKKTGRGWEMLTNFDEGVVYLEYLGELYLEDGFMVPDNETIREWIFAELRKETYSYLWDNGEEVKTKLDEAKQELHLKKEQARQIWTRQEVSTYYNIANILQRRYKNHENWISHKAGSTRYKIC